MSPTRTSQRSNKTHRRGDSASHLTGDHRRTSSGRAQGVLKMEDVDVSRQLKQMTDFIRQEAVEIEAAAAEVSPPHPSSVHCLLEDFKGRIS